MRCFLVLAAVAILGACGDSAVEPTTESSRFGDLRPRADCRLFGDSDGGWPCYQPTLPSTTQHNWLVRAIEYASSINDFTCQQLVSSMNMMLNKTFFVPDAFQSTYNGEPVTAMGDYHYAQRGGGAAEIHLSAGITTGGGTGFYTFDERRIGNTFAHEAYHAFTTDNYLAQAAADRCVPYDRSPTGPGQAN